MATAKQRTVMLFGAGASIEYGIPATQGFTQLIEAAVLADAWVRSQRGDHAYATIKQGLERYLTNPGLVHFEQIYHCAHELLYFKPPTTGAVDEFRPLLVPFIQDLSGTTDESLRALLSKMTETIYAEVVRRCKAPTCPLTPFANFLNSARSSGILRLYTTNYDDFALQACPTLYTGYVPAGAKETPFDAAGFWRRGDDDALFFLHGSVHMSYSHSRTDGLFADLVWFDDAEEALKSASFSGSGVRRMDGSEVLRAPVITGLDKLSRLQQRPFPFLYSAFTRDVSEADLIYVIGFGLGDLHLNSILAEARSRKNSAPIVFVDYWDTGAYPALFDPDRKELEMFHALRIEIGGNSGRHTESGNWLISSDRSAAVWTGGFQNFLNEPGQHNAAVGMLTPRQP